MAETKNNSAHLVKMGQRIRAARKRLKFTQVDLADLLGVTNVAVSHWEIGLRDPGVTVLVEIAAALGVLPGDLLSDDPVGGSPLLDKTRLAQVLANIDAHSKQRFDALSSDQKAGLVAHLYPKAFQPTKAELWALIDLMQ